jgi:hypothetical protein
MTTAAAHVSRSLPGAPPAWRGCRRRPFDPKAHRDRLRVSRRLAAGMSPREVARAEAVDEAAIAGLLAESEFRALVAAFVALEERPPEEQTARLVKLARQTIERAMADGDVRAAIFVLRKTGAGRDPADTLARGVLASCRRAARAATAPPAAPPPGPAASRPHDPLAGMLRHGAAALRAAIVAEHATRHAARAAVAREQAEAQAPAAGAEATAVAARRALALKTAAADADTRPAAAALARLTRRLVGQAGTVALRPCFAPSPASPLVAALPRRPRAP